MYAHNGRAGFGPASGIAEDTPGGARSETGDRAAGPVQIVTAWVAARNGEDGQDLDLRMGSRRPSGGGPGERPRPRSGPGSNRNRVSRRENEEDRPDLNLRVAAAR